MAELDGEVAVVLDAEAFELLDAICVTLDGFEELGAHQVIGDCEVPCVDEVVGGQRRTVGELEAVFEGDMVGVVTFEADVLCEVVVGVALFVHADETCENAAHDAGAADFVGVGGYESAFRLAAVGGDVVVSGCALVGGVGGACAQTDQGECCSAKRYGFSSIHFRTYLFIQARPSSLKCSSKVSLAARPHNLQITHVPIESHLIHFPWPLHPIHTDNQSTSPRLHCPTRLN